MIHPERLPRDVQAQVHTMPHDFSLLVLRLLSGGADREATPAGGKPLGFQLPRVPLQVRPPPFTIVDAQMVKYLPAMRETWVQSLGWEDPLEKEIATQSSILAWKIP